GRAQPRRVSRAAALEADRPAVARARPQRDEEELVTRRRQQALEPLDGSDPGAVERLTQEERVHQRRLAAVQVDGVQREPSAPVLGGDDEGGAVHDVRVDTEPGGQAPDQARLPRTEVADQAEQLAAARRATEPGAQRLGLVGARGRGLAPRVARGAHRAAAPAWRRAMVGGSSSIRSPARRPTSPRRSTTASAAAPCAKTPNAAAVAASRPCASRPPMMPESTSPMPPLAMPGFPVGEIATAPSGAAITVGPPFKTVTTPCSAANRRAIATRSSCTSRVVPPTRRAISPGCGVT